MSRDKKINRAEVKTQKEKMVISIINMVRGFKTVDPSPESLEAAKEIEEDLARSLREPAQAV